MPPKSEVQESSSRDFPLVGSYERPIRHLIEAREHLICNPPRIGDAVRVLEGAVVDLGGPKLWGAPRKETP